MIEGEVNSSVHQNRILQKEGADNVIIINTSKCNDSQNSNNSSSISSCIDVAKLQCKCGNHRQTKCIDKKSRCKHHHNNRCSTKANK